MRVLLINAGPVSGPGVSKGPGDIGAVDWGFVPDIVTISGEGSSYFSGLASSWTKDGHILPSLLANYGRVVSDYDKIGVTGFSAGHGLFGPLLLLDGDSIDAAVLFDSCFTGKGPPSHPSNGKDGYASFGERAIRGEKLLVMTSSWGANPPTLVATATGSECALASFQRALDAAGASDTSFAVPPGILTTNPKGSNFYAKTGGLETHHAGDFFVLDYGPVFYHGDHPRLLTRDVLQAFMAPYLATGEVPGLTGGVFSGTSRTPLVVGGVVLTLLAVAGGVALARKRAA